MGTAYGGNIWSGGTVFSAIDRPGGPFLGGDRVQRDTTQPNALRPRVKIFTESVVVFALAWLEKNQKN